MALSALPLSYCTNVHPGRTVAEVELGLDQYTVPVRDAIGAELAAGLWLAQPVIAELLADESLLVSFADRLQERGLTCYTLNAFPYGDFHGERVKENVYLPDWSEQSRLEYTKNCATVLAQLIPEQCDGSISTVPLGFKEFEHGPDFLRQCHRQLIDLAVWLRDLRDETGRTIRLAIEPEPFCRLETTAEVITFFEQLRSQAADENQLDTVTEFLGLCYDVCHQAVEFEEIPESIRAIDEVGIRINKVHITCAIHLDDPANNTDGRSALAEYVEPRYLHQTMARSVTGTILRKVDLDRQLALESDGEFLNAESWRVHYHVPVNAEQLGPLRTTREELKQALRAVKGLNQAPHLEVETYTWEVLPDGDSISLVEGLSNELTATRGLLDAL